MNLAMYSFPNRVPVISFMSKHAIVFNAECPTAIHIDMPTQRITIDDNNISNSIQTERLHRTGTALNNRDTAGWAIYMVKIFLLNEGPLLCCFTDMWLYSLEPHLPNRRKYTFTANIAS